MARRPKGPARGRFTDDENEVLRAALDRIVEDLGTQAEAAKVLQVSQPSIANYLNRKSGFGGEVAGRVARHFGHDSLLAFFDERGKPAQGVPERYPNRERVAVAAKVLRLDPAMVDSLRALKLKADQADAPVLFWLKQLVRILEASEGPQLDA